MPIRRILAVALGATLVVVMGAGAVAWAGPGGHRAGGGGGDPARREAAKQCLADARAANPDADRAAVRAAAKPCLEAAGITPRAALGRLRDCIDQVLAAHPDADRKALRSAVRDCLHQT
jgi:hypothetical protein